jgi:hypothetical protein
MLDTPKVEPTGAQIIGEAEPEEARPPTFSDEALALRFAISPSLRE